MIFFIDYLLFFEHGFIGYTATLLGKPCFCMPPDDDLSMNHKLVLLIVKDFNTFACPGLFVKEKNQMWGLGFSK